MADFNFLKTLDLAGLTQSALGAYSQGSGARMAGLLESDMQALNARLFGMQAIQAIQAGKEQEQAVKANTNTVISQQRTAVAANGVDVGSGNAAEVQQSARMVGDMDVDAVRRNARNQAFGYTVAATQAKMNSRMKRITSKGISPLSAGFNDLLTNASTVAQRWYRYDKEGM